MSFFRQFPKTAYDFEDNGIDTKIVDLFRFVKINDAYLDDLSLYTYYQVSNGERPDVVSNKLYGSPEYYWTFFIANEQLKTGLSGWPMSSGEFDSYLEDEYSGTVIETWPYRNYQGASVGTYAIGEQVHGSLSGASGYVVSKDAQMSQVLLRDVDGTFRSNSNETLYGETSASNVGIARVYLHRDAPHHFEDSDGNIVYNQRFINESPTSEDPTQSLSTITNYEYEMQLNDERGNIRIVRPEAVYAFAKKFRELINA